MATTVAEIILVSAGIHAALGLAFAMAFVARGAGVLDPVAKNSPWSFRVLIIPASAALWPYLLLRWIKAARVKA